MRLTNNQLGHLQLLVQAFSSAVSVLNAPTWPHAETQEERAMRELGDMLITASQWRDLQQLSSDLKDLYNSGHPVTLTPEVKP